MSKTHTRDGKEQKETRDPEDLRPHPYSTRLYRQRVPSRRFIEDIAEQMEEPLVVNEDGEIIDGVRRWLAALKEGMDSVEVVEEPNRTDEEEQEAILRHNDDRDETFSQKMRVALEYEEMIAPALEERMKAGKSLDEQEDDPILKSEEGATALKLAGDRVDWGKDKYRKAKQIWQSDRASELVDRIEDGSDELTVNSAWQALTEDEDKEPEGGIAPEPIARDKLDIEEPVQASFRLSIYTLKRLLNLSTVSGTEYEDLYLEVRSDEVRILNRTTLEEVLTYVSAYDDYFEDITLEGQEPVGVILDVERVNHYLRLVDTDGGDVRVELRGDPDSDLASKAILISGSIYGSLVAPDDEELLSEVPKWMPERFTDDDVYINTEGDRAPTIIDTDVSEVEKIIWAVENTEGAEFYPVIVDEGALRFRVDGDETYIEGSLEATVEGPDIENTYYRGFTEVFDILSLKVELQTASGNNPLVAVRKDSDRVVRHIIGPVS